MDHIEFSLLVSLKEIGDDAFYGEMQTHSLETGLATE